MAKGHWLDPLARGLLLATGQIPRPPAAAPAGADPGGLDAGRDPGAESIGGPHGGPEAEASIERELLALKLAQNPSLRLRSAEEVLHAAALGWRLEVNRATSADWLRLPGCTPCQVDRLLQRRREGIQLSGTDELQTVLQVSDALIQAWRPLLDFRWHGAGPAPGPAPLDLNRCSAALLQARLPLLEPCRRRLLQERRRQPFRDLADLQQRLQLPSAVVESLIGTVCFGQGPSSPELPGPPRRTSTP
jgi:DNA uptake protein ComE-like DNA-binding protein